MNEVHSDYDLIDITLRKGESTKWAIESFRRKRNKKIMRMIQMSLQNKKIIYL